MIHSIRSIIHPSSHIDFDKVYGKNGKLVVGSNCDLVNLQIIFSAPNSLCQIGDNCSLSGTIKIGANSSCCIGNNVSSAKNFSITALESTTCYIGNDCLFSHDVLIRTSDGHNIYDLNGERLNSAESILIEDRVWVGCRVVILKGVIIRSDSVVGAGSIVTESFDNSNVIIAGNPAEIIKKDICWKY